MKETLKKLRFRELSIIAPTYVGDLRSRHFRSQYVSENLDLMEDGTHLGKVVKTFPGCKLGDSAKGVIFINTTNYFTGKPVEDKIVVTSKYAFNLSWFLIRGWAPDEYVNRAELDSIKPGDDLYVTTGKGWYPNFTVGISEKEKKTITPNKKEDCKKENAEKYINTKPR